MFKNTFQSGFLSILYSIGSKPLQIWDKKGARPLALPAGRLARGVLTSYFFCLSKYSYQLLLRIPTRIASSLLSEA